MSKNMRPTTHADLESDNRARAQVHERSTGSETTPHHLREQRRAKVDEDGNIGELRILSGILRGIGMTKVCSPQRVVDVCHRYGLVKGDSFDLCTGFELSDPAVQKRSIQRIIETNAVLVTLSPPCTKFSGLQALNMHIHGPEWATDFEKERQKGAERIA